MSFLLVWCLVFIAIAGAAHAQVNCLVDTGTGIIDLAQIPQKSLVMTQSYQGKFSEQIFKFNLCTASSEPPQGADNCNTMSFVGEWAMDRTCEPQFDLLLQQPTYNNSVVTVGYYNQNAWTAKVQIKCGTTPLESDGAVNVSYQLQFTIMLKSQYACPQQPPNSCKVGPVDLLSIPRKAFPVKVVDANGSSTQHVVQLSFCMPTDRPPRGAESCGVAAYYGLWSSMGACESQFDAVPSPGVFNGTHTILYFGNKKSSQLSTVYLGCGTKDLDVIGVTRNSRGDLFTTATSKYACAPTCTVQTPRGIVDLSRIPETVLDMWDSREGQRFGSSTYRFSLCQLSIVPPSGSEFCGKSYVGRWIAWGKCIRNWQYDKGSPLSYAGGILAIAYASTQYVDTLTVLIECGNATLAAAGDTINKGDHTDVPLSSKYACV